MNGQQILDMVTSILGGESPDQTYLLQIVNISRINIEAMRAWKVLSTKDTSMTVGGSNKYTIAFTLPSNFKRFLGESTSSQGLIRLFDGNTNIQYLYEVPFENILEYKDVFGYFAVDYANQQFYITGVVPGNFTIVLNYIKKTAPITLATTWTNFDSDYHPILAFDTAARWRLGTDYDDVNARNADDNGKMATAIFETMASWDTEMAISTINNIEYPNPNDNYSGRGMKGYGPRGVRASN
jgi:hypothetical protein